MSENTPEYIQLVSDSELNNNHSGQFGHMSKRQVVDESVLKIAAGYWIGHTAQQILKSHRLMFEEKGELLLTRKGKAYLYHRYQHISEHSTVSENNIQFKDISPGSTSSYLTNTDGEYKTRGEIKFKNIRNS